MTTGIFLTIAIAVIASPLLAQPGNPKDPDPDVPIGGVEILLMVGGALGIGKILKPGKYIRKKVIT